MVTLRDSHAISSLLSSNTSQVMANQRGFDGATLLQLEAKGDFFTRRTLIEQKRIEDIDAVSLFGTREDLELLTTLRFPVVDITEIYSSIS